MQVDELLKEARVDYVRADDVDEAMDKLGALLRNLPKPTVRTPKAEAAKYLERMGMPQVGHVSNAPMKASCSANMQANCAAAAAGSSWACLYRITSKPAAMHVLAKGLQCFNDMQRRM